MVRTRVKKTGLPKWEKIGGGTLTFKGKAYKRGDIIEAREGEIPEAFRDVLRPLGPVTEQTVAPEPVFEMKEVEATAEEKEKDGFEQLYNVVNKAGKVINDSSLSKDEAEKLLKDLNE